MANFSRVKPAGWALNEIFTSAQANGLDINTASSVNGDGGGSYAGDLSWTGDHDWTGACRLVYEQDSTTIPAGGGGTIALDTTTAEVFIAENNPGGATIVELKTSTPTPSTGRVIVIKRPGITHGNTYTFTSGVGGATIASMKTGITNVTALTFQFDGTNWTVIGYTGAPADFTNIT